MSPCIWRSFASVVRSEMRSSCIGSAAASSKAQGFVDGAFGGVAAADLFVLHRRHVQAAGAQREPFRGRTGREQALAQRDAQLDLGVGGSAEAVLNPCAGIAQQIERVPGSFVPAEVDGQDFLTGWVEVDGFDALLQSDAD